MVDSKTEVVDLDSSGAIIIPDLDDTHVVQDSDIVPDLDLDLDVDNSEGVDLSDNTVVDEDISKPPCGGCGEGYVCNSNSEICLKAEEGTAGQDPENINEPDGLGGTCDPLEWGKPVGYFCGVASYSNNNSITTNEKWGYTNGTDDFGYRHQCTSFVMRFLCGYYGGLLDGCDEEQCQGGNKCGHAKHWFRNTLNNKILNQTTGYENGGSEAPRPGDILIWDGSKYGHVAVIRNVVLGEVTSHVTIIEQNQTWSPCDAKRELTLIVNDNTYRIKDGVKKILGWRRVNDSSAANCDDPEYCENKCKDAGRTCGEYMGCNCGTCSGCESECNDSGTCEPKVNAGYTCASDGNIYWEDSCGKQENEKEPCANGCAPETDACITCADICSNANRECGDYTDSEGNQCECGTCDSDCKDTCNESGACIASDTTQIKCNNNILWFVDSCGNLGSVDKPCFEGCVDGEDHCNACTDETYNEDTFCSGNVLTGKNSCGETKEIMSCAHGCDSSKKECKPNPCTGVTCNTPPTNTCLNTTTLRSYSSSGTCSDGDCDYDHSDITCKDGCDSTKSECKTCTPDASRSCGTDNNLHSFDSCGNDEGVKETCNFGCDSSANKCKPDPCSGKTCSAPPKNNCISTTTLRSYSSPGTCSNGDCSYSHSDTTCKNGCDSTKNACKTCDQTTDYVCNSGHLYYKDSCGKVTSSRHKTCDAGCNNGDTECKCYDTSYNESKYCKPNTEELWGKNKCGESDYLETCSYKCSNGVCKACEDSTYGERIFCQNGNSWGENECKETDELEKCSNGCDNATGLCNTCPATQYWSPTSMEDSDTESNVTLSAGFKANGGDKVWIRTCKDSGTFSQDVHIKFMESKKGSGAIYNGMVTSSGRTCSLWKILDTSGWDTDQQFGGKVRIVSPGTCASKWNDSCSNDPGCGTCWLVNTSTMTRTCK